MTGTTEEAKRLRRNVEWTLRRAVDPGAVVPMLHRLTRLAPEASDENVFAHRLLAELLADTHPWRAALHARRVLLLRPNDDGAWAMLALAYALLGYYRSAASAYRKAAGLSPDNAAYAHNLGHLLDVALERPREALPWLRSAYDATEKRSDVAVSYAHALGRAGKLDEAKAVARQALLGDQDMSDVREHAALVRWIEDGAQKEAAILPRRPPARAFGGAWSAGAGETKRRRGARASGTGRHASLAQAGPELLTDALELTLARGLAKLPLDRVQRERARALMERVSRRALPTDAAALPGVAAAIAYAVIHAEEIPLTQADVAACFRVGVQVLRGRWKALRHDLELAASVPPRSRSGPA